MCAAVEMETYKKAERQRSEKPYAMKRYVREVNAERINGMYTMKELDLKGMQQPG